VSESERKGVSESVSGCRCQYLCSSPLRAEVEVKAVVVVEVEAVAVAVAMAMAYLKLASSWWMSMSVNSTLRSSVGRGGSVSSEHACTGTGETRPGARGEKSRVSRLLPQAL
jgi:hypothetical protein